MPEDEVQNSNLFLLSKLRSLTPDILEVPIALDPDMPNAVVYKTAHYFTIDGTKHKATEACAA